MTAVVPEMGLRTKTSPVSLEGLFFILLIFELVMTVTGRLISAYPPAIVTYALFFTLTLTLYWRSIGNRLVVKYYLLILPLIVIGWYFTGSLSSTLSSGRLLLLLPLFICINRIEYNPVYSFLTLLLVVVLMYVNVFLGSAALIDLIGLSDYYASRNIPPSEDGTPFGFSTRLFELDAHRAWIGFVAADKAAYGGLVVIALLHKCYEGIRGGLQRAIFALLAILISSMVFIEIIFVKAALMALILVLSIRLLSSYFNSAGKIFAVLLLALTCVTTLVLVLVPMQYLSSSGAISHIHGLMGPFISQSEISKLLWGNGLGTGGTLGGNLRDLGGLDGDLTKGDIGGESTLGAYVYQVGIIGIVYLMWVVYFVFRKKLDYVSMSFLFVVFVVGIFSEAVTAVAAMLAILILCRSLLGKVN